MFIASLSQFLYKYSVRNTTFMEPFCITNSRSLGKKCRV